MHILFLSTWYPYPADNGSKLRILGLLEGLAGRHQVTLLSFAEKLPAGPSPLLGDLCRAIEVVQRPAYRPGGGKALVGLLSPTPRVVLDTWSAEMAAKIEAHCRTGRYDLVIASQWPMAAYWAYFAKRPALYEEVEPGTYQSKIEQAATPAGKIRHRLTLFKLRYYLRRQLAYFRACTVVSAPEKALLQQLAPQATIAIIPNGLNLTHYQNISASRQTNTLIFTGSLTFEPNYEAMAWFISQVYPLIQAKVGDVRLVVTGKVGQRQLPPAGNMTLTGYVEDVRPLLASATVSLAPILHGGGTRLKILEAMALRTPVVATTKGAEGLEVVNGQQLLLADTPQDFANAVLSLLESPGRSYQLSQNAYHLLQSHYDSAVILPRFLTLTEKITTS